MSTSVYQFIYIAPSLPFPVAVPKNLPQRRPILNGFTTLFSAYGVDPNGVSHQITSESLKWFLNGILITSTEQPISVGENTISALKKDGQVQVTSTSVGRAVPLVAEYEGFKGEVILTVEEPDFQSIYIAPPLAFPVAVPKNPPQVLPILKGFTTWFSAYGVDPKGVSHQITSESVNWSLN
ncbi:MAG TPA: hypothetical protein VEZ71_00330, partial [Archangium sp.]|nr:hypothetical protein [Archangium sp.]